jgi:hypothetical protein
LALMAEISRSRLIASTRLAEEEMVLLTHPGARPPSFVTVEELNHTPLILGDGLRAALDVLLAGRGIALRVDTELNDHETIRLMVQQDVGASILPHSSVYRECARGLAQAHRITEAGVFRILALGAAESRAPSAARQAVAEVVTKVLGDIEAAGKLRPQIPEPIVALPMPTTAVEPTLFSRPRGASKRGGGTRRQILSPRPAREVSHKSAPLTDKTPAVLSAGQDRSGRNR